MALYLQTGPIVCQACWDAQVLQEMVPVLQSKLKDRPEVEKMDMGKVWCWWRPEPWGPHSMRLKKGQGAVLVLIVPVLGKQHMGGGSGQPLAPWPDGHDQYDHLPSPIIPACCRAPKWSQSPKQSPSASPNGFDRLSGSLFSWMRGDFIEVIALKQT